MAPRKSRHALFARGIALTSRSTSCMRPELAVVLPRAIRPHAHASDTLVNMVVEDHPAVVDALIAMGAIVRLEMVHMKGVL